VRVGDIERIKAREIRCPGCGCAITVRTSNPCSCFRDRRPNQRSWADSLVAVPLGVILPGSEERV